MAGADGIVMAMENTQPHPTSAKGLAGRLLADQHSLPLSIALHLIPGALIVAAYFLIGEPIVKAIEYPTFLGWAIAMCVALAPIQLGLLLWLGFRRNGRLSLTGVLGYTGKPTSRGKLIGIVIALIAQFVIVSMVLTKLDDIVFKAFFTWIPFGDMAGSSTAYLDRYPHGVMTFTLAICIPLTGFAFPLIEELYFRGFLMPRLSRLGAWAPVLSTVLFSLYHLWSPWVFFSRVIFFFAGPWFVWRKKDLRISIGMHPGTTLLLQTFGTIALLFNLV